MGAKRAAGIHRPKAFTMCIPTTDKPHDAEVGCGHGGDGEIGAAYRDSHAQVASRSYNATYASGRVKCSGVAIIRIHGVRSFPCLDHSQVSRLGCDASFGLRQTRVLIGFCCHWKGCYVLHVPPCSPHCGLRKIPASCPLPQVLKMRQHLLVVVNLRLVLYRLHELELR
jgi:hypothetical protein